MLGMIAYIFGALVLAFLIAGIFNAIRPVKSQAESSVWRTALVLWIVVMAGPYIYAEANTRMYADELQDPVNEVINGMDINGGLEYYKVTLRTSEKARVIAIAKDEQSYGNDRPIVSIGLVRDGDEWMVDEYRFISKFDKGQDGVSIPPYW